MYDYMVVFFDRIVDAYVQQIFSENVLAWMASTSYYNKRSLFNRTQITLQNLQKWQNIEQAE